MPYVKGNIKVLPVQGPCCHPCPGAVIGVRDDELKAMFVYLKSIKSIKNLVPQAQPPVIQAR
jgi:(p)ppGpp synthase/HD superfamily hydrolase